MTQFQKTKIRIYQTYMHDVDRRDQLVGDPLPVDVFLPYVHHEYRTALGIEWQDMPVAMVEITREWLEGLAVGSTTNLIGVESEDWWLRVKVTEIQVPGGSQATPIPATSNTEYGYAVINSVPYSGCCGKGFRLTDIMETAYSTEIYTDEAAFIDCVNKVIANEIEYDCIQFECGGDNDNYCGKPHETLHIYPHGTKLTVDDLRKMPCFNRDVDPDDITIISEPYEGKWDNKSTVWICKYRLVNVNKNSDGKATSTETLKPVCEAAKSVKYPINGYALIHSAPNSGCCDKGFKLTDIMDSVFDSEIYTDEARFIAHVNDYISDEIRHDCEDRDCCDGIDGGYCRKPHEDEHIYPYGTKLTVEDLQKMTYFDNESDPADNIVILEPGEGNACASAQWVCKFQLMDAPSSNVEKSHTGGQQQRQKKLRLYQTYKKYIDSKDTEISVPMSIDEFIGHVHSEYQSAAIDWEWEDKPVAREDITREWLEGLAAGTYMDLIAEYSEDMWLRVIVSEAKFNMSDAVDDEGSEDTKSEGSEDTKSEGSEDTKSEGSEDTKSEGSDEDAEDVYVNTCTNAPISAGYALVKLEHSICGTGYHIRDVMNLIETIKIYSNPNDFCAFVNEYISKQMIEDCENSEECAVYCRNPHADFRVYPMGTCINPDDLANLDGNMVIIDEPREQRKHKTSPRELVWICKVSISNSAN
jgi:hypothetical protein